MIGSSHNGANTRESGHYESADSHSAEIMVADLSKHAHRPCHRTLILKLRYRKSYRNFSKISRIRTVALPSRKRCSLARMPLGISNSVQFQMSSSDISHLCRVTVPFLRSENIPHPLYHTEKQLKCQIDFA